MNNTLDLLAIIKKATKAKKLSTKAFEKFCQDYNLDDNQIAELLEAVIDSGISIGSDREYGPDFEVKDSVDFYMKFVAENGYDRLLTLEEEQAFGKRIKENNDQDAKEELANYNCRLVISVASMYQNRGVSLDDLIQEGMQGLWKAIEKYDYTLGYKFSTYAVNWIRQAVTRAIADQGRTIRIPVHMVEQINKFTRIRNSIEQEQGREATNEEIAEAMNISVDKVVEIKKVIDLEPVSIDKPVGEDDDSFLVDFVPTTEYGPDDLVERNIQREEILKLIDTICTEREAYVLKYRYGLIDGKEHTLEDTASVVSLAGDDKCKMLEKRLLAEVKKKAKLTECELLAYMLRFGLTDRTEEDMTVEEIADFMQVTKEEVKIYLHDAFAKVATLDLQPQMKLIFTCRSGLNKEHKAYSVEETSKRITITRERVRQIEGKALRKLGRNPKIRDWVAT